MTNRNEQMEEGWKLTEADLQVCECGDYRFQHVRGVGRCRMADGLSHGFKPCLRFRLTPPRRDEG